MQILGEAGLREKAVRIYTDFRFWLPDEPRVERRRKALWVKLWKVKGAARELGFRKDVCRTLIVEWS